MKDEIMNRAIEAYIEKLECENNRAKQIFSGINEVIGFEVVDLTVQVRTNIVRYWTY